MGTVNGSYERTQAAQSDATNVRPRAPDPVGDLAEWECSKATFAFVLNAGVDFSGAKALYGIGRASIRVANLGLKSLRGFWYNRLSELTATNMAVGFPTSIVTHTLDDPNFDNNPHSSGIVAGEAMLGSIVPGISTYLSGENALQKCIKPN